MGRAEAAVGMLRAVLAGIFGLERTRKEEDGEEDRFKEVDLTRLGAEGEVGRVPIVDEIVPVE